MMQDTAPEIGSISSLSKRGPEQLKYSKHLRWLDPQIMMGLDTLTIFPLFLKITLSKDQVQVMRTHGAKSSASCPSSP